MESAEERVAKGTSLEVVETTPHFSTFRGQLQLRYLEARAAVLVVQARPQQGQQKNSERRNDIRPSAKRKQRANRDLISCGESRSYTEKRTRECVFAGDLCKNSATRWSRNLRRTGLEPMRIASTGLKSVVLTTRPTTLLRATQRNGTGS